MPTTCYTKYLCALSLLFAFILLQLSCTNSFGQRINSVFFEKLPQDYQLYPRDEHSEASVPVSGVIELRDYKYMAVQVFRNQTLVKYLRAEIKYDSNGKGYFSTSAKIKAELAEYSFKVYACKLADSALIVHRQNVVSGDVYLLTGQSNATGFFNGRDTNEYCRSFGKITENLNTNPYDPADTLWALSNQEKSGAWVGPMGLELQKTLVENSSIPNCLINGGFHWSTTSAHANRTADNPADLNNGYGRMLYRVEKAGLKDAVKAFIFRQGESEAYHDGLDWEGNFDKLRKNLHLDLPNLKLLYVFQIDIIYFPSQIGASIRNYQRRLPQVYPDVRSLATVGTFGYDGLHYAEQGYQQGGKELARLIERDFYQRKDTLNINSPGVKRAFYSNKDQNQLIISFDEGQQLIYPEKYQPDYSAVTMEMKDFFYLNQKSGSVVSGKAIENRVILDLNGTQNGSTLNYLPDYIQNTPPYFKYTGPYITNKLGMRAFSFFNFPIGTALNTPKLTAKQGTVGTIALAWTGVANATAYVIERKTAPDQPYEFLTSVATPTLTFIDKAQTNSNKIYYRIKAVSALSESFEYSYAESDFEIVLATVIENTTLFSVYPNPLKSSIQALNIRFKKPVAGTVSLINPDGKVLTQQHINQKDEITMKIGALSPSIYFIHFQSEKTQHVAKLIIE